MKIEMWNIEKPIPYDRNPRKISDKAITEVANSIAEAGFRQPIVVDKNGIIVVGHTRLQASKKLGLKEVPVHVADDLTDDQIRMYRVRDNKSGEFSEWDMEILNCDFELPELEVMGFDKADLPQTENEGLTDEDDVPEVAEDAVAKLGDIWTLGDHRLMCGDSTSIDAVERLMGGESCDLLTDPPYGISADNMTLGTGKQGFHRGSWDSEIPDFIQTLEFFEKRIIWGGNYFTDRLEPTNDWLCWHKKNDGLSFSEFELAWSNLGNNCRILSHHWSGEKKLHPTMKPVEVMVWCVEMLGPIVFDLFGGSGSTLIACEKTGRDCCMMELDPKYCDVIIKRWQDFVGRDAILERTGETFNAISKS